MNLETECEKRNVGMRDFIEDCRNRVVCREGLKDAVFQQCYLVQC